LIKPFNKRKKSYRTNNKLGVRNISKGGQIAANSGFRNDKVKSLESTAEESGLKKLEKRRSKEKSEKKNENHWRTISAGIKSETECQFGDRCFQFQRLDEKSTRKFDLTLTTL
jgi:hypothetical protein